MACPPSSESSVVVPVSPCLLRYLHQPHVSPEFDREGAGVDTSVIALWLGHAGVRSTDAYVHADITIKERALALTTPAAAKPGRYRPTDKMLAFLERPPISGAKPLDDTHTSLDRVGSLRLGLRSPGTSMTGGAATTPPSG
jgi:hypothetical protein